jgi:predicted transcriptional regulator
MDVNISVSKSYANEIINDYMEIVGQVDSIIKQTGYKGKFIAKKMGLPESTFYQKKRKKSFTYKEMQQLIALMDDDGDDDAIEEAYLMKIHKERENKVGIPLDDFIAQLKIKKGITD